MAHNLIARGEPTGEIAKNGKVLVKQYDYFCLRHVKKVHQPPDKYTLEVEPIKMKQVLVEEYRPKELENNITLPEEDHWVVLLKSCPKCGQIIKEGEYIK